jgi:hypothetical protein
LTENEEKNPKRAMITLFYQPIQHGIKLLLLISKLKVSIFIQPSPLFFDAHTLYIQ